ncbi:MAG TPA: S8 family serine peptidase [Gaiellaceae bacterium]|nr:S8 family serine peptidase [Gaiellaceae bacterium]
MKLALAACLALALAAPAQGARFAVGLDPGADADAVAARLDGRLTREHLALGALTLHAPGAAGVARVPGVSWVERLDETRRLAFTPADPLAGRQWYLDQIRAFSAWEAQPPLAGPLVAVVDSGIDGDHPEFRGRIAEARSFVGGKATTDAHGHGTFVAGLIAAAHDGKGIAGIAFPSQLLVAKVVQPDGTVSLEAEVAAIRWAVDRGARVINLSLGGVRDPLNPSRDTYSPLEAAAVDYAVARGAVLVAAVGNADQAPERPWGFASYPSALPHVIGVSALGRDGSVPAFSDRDRIFNDLSAPGQEMLSTFPRALSRSGCANAGYSDCGPEEFRRAEGTSFAAPQVTAAAALLLAVRPDLRADQVAYLLTRTAADVSPSTGCRECAAGRDALSGWGRLDVANAVSQAGTGKLPVPDRLETNDDAGIRARTLWGPSGRRVEATIDFWDDQSDVFRIRLKGSQRLFAALSGPAAAKLSLWRPGTSTVDGLSLRVQRMRLVQSRPRAAQERLAYRVPPRRGGWYYLQVKLGAPGAGTYVLSYAKR